MTAPIVLVGGGLASGTAVTTLRETGYDGEIVVLAAEDHPPYERPPLSKAYLRGEAEVESTYVHPQSWYADHDVEVRMGCHVDAIDLDAHRVNGQGAAVAYSKLLLATGSRARLLPVVGTEQVDVHYLRTLDDASRLRTSLVVGCHLLVVGGGWIGMEVAASARQLGVEVTLVEPSAQPLLRVLGPELGAFLAAEHRRQGVDLRTGVGLRSLSGRVAVLTDDTSLEVDAVVIGVGAVPNDELAQSAGLAVDNGVQVDSALRSSDPDVYAAGDVASLLHPTLEQRVRVEHWQNAVSQGRAAALSMLGEPIVYEEIPSFFSDQYDLGLEYFGYLGSRVPEAVRIEPGATKDVRSALWYVGDRVVAAAHVNDWSRSEELAERVRVGR